jgi:hypothetical protein
MGFYTSASGAGDGEGAVDGFCEEVNMTAAERYG